MNVDEARVLARRIVDTWPTGPQGYIWRDIVAALDADRAAESYRTMVVEAIHRPPTPGQFLAAYHAHGERAAVHTQRHAPLYNPAEGPIMGRDEFVELLERLTAIGDTEAAGDLALWRRIIAREGDAPPEPPLTLGEF